MAFQGNAAPAHDDVCIVGEWRPLLVTFDAQVKQNDNEQIHTLLIQQVLVCNRRAEHFN